MSVCASGQSDNQAQATRSCIRGRSKESNRRVSFSNVPPPSQKPLEQERVLTPMQERVLTPVLPLAGKATRCKELGRTFHRSFDSMGSTSPLPELWQEEVMLKQHASLEEL